MQKALPFSLVYRAQFAFLFVLIFFTRIQAKWVLSEVMADPLEAYDTYGEFLELIQIGPDASKPGDLSIRIDGMLLKIEPENTPPESKTNSVFLICRDSTILKNGGLVCQSQSSNMNLANGRMLSIEILQGGESQVFLVPASKPGVSWENTMDVSSKYLDFLPSLGSWGKVGKASPGKRNSRSMQPAELDLGVSSLVWDREGEVQVKIENLGRSQNLNAALSLWLDRDWDGEFETFIDSLLVAAPTLSIRIPPGARGLLQATLSEDENPTNNAQQIPLEAGPPLTLQEWCPAPDSGRPEWIEVKNVSAEIDGQGRSINLSSLTINGLPLSKNGGDLVPGDYVVIVENAKLFQAHFGEIKVRLFELPHWPVLRNTGDTITLAMSGFLMDQVVYRARDLQDGGECLTRYAGELKTSSGSPGFTEDFALVPAWELSSRVWNPGENMFIKVQATPGQRFTLSLYDLDGNGVRQLAMEHPGTGTLVFDGKGNRGECLPRGAYILALSLEGQQPKRTVIAVTGQ